MPTMMTGRWAARLRAEHFAARFAELSARSNDERPPPDRTRAAVLVDSGGLHVHRNVEPAGAGPAGIAQMQGAFQVVADGFGVDDDTAYLVMPSTMRTMSASWSPSWRRSEVP